MLTLPNPASMPCPVDTARRRNRQGPFCGLCRAIREARAAAHLRGWQLRITRARLPRRTAIAVSCAFWLALGLAAWLDAHLAPARVPVTAAWWAIFIGWIVTAAAAVAQAAVTIAITIAHAIIIVGAAIAAFAAQVASIFLKVYDYLGKAWSTAIKPGLEYAWRGIDVTRRWLVRVIGPVIDAVEKVRKYVLDIYDKWFRPVLDTIGAMRRILQLLASLRVQWARDLDRRLAALEDRIVWPIQQALRRLNEVSNWLNRIMTLDGYLQRITLIQSLLRYQADALKVWWQSVHRPTSAGDQATLRAPVKPRTADAIVTEIREAAEFGQGRDAAIADEWIADVRLELRA